MSSDWSSCPLIGHHVIVIMLEYNKQKFHHSQKNLRDRHTYIYTDKCNPTDAIASNKDVNNLVNCISHVDVITFENKTYYYYYYY